MHFRNKSDSQKPAAKNCSSCKKILIVFSYKDLNAYNSSERKQILSSDIVSLFFIRSLRFIEKIKPWLLTRFKFRGDRLDVRRSLDDNFLDNNVIVVVRVVLHLDVVGLLLLFGSGWRGSRCIEVCSKLIISGGEMLMKSLSRLVKCLRKLNLYLLIWLKGLNLFQSHTSQNNETLP